MAASEETDLPFVVLAGGRQEWRESAVGALRAALAGRGRVRAAPDAQAALRLLEHLEDGNATVAVVVVHGGLPGAPWHAFLDLASATFPAAQRLVVMRPIDQSTDLDPATEAARVGLAGEVYGVPESAPLETLVQRVADLLDRQDVRERAPVDAGEGIRVVGDTDPATHLVRDFFARNSIPHRFVPVESEEGRALLPEGVDRARLPVVLTGDGQVLVGATLFEIAVALGEPDRPRTDSYDLVVVGAGPAGLAAAVNAASEGLATLLVDRGAVGGQAGTSSRIENYVGFPLGISGAALAARAFRQAVRLGADTFGPVPATGLEPSDGAFTLALDGRARIRARAVLLALGVSWNQLDLPEARSFEGRGVYYGSALAAVSNVRGRDVHVVGGANSAGQAAVYLADAARSVTLLVRGPSLEAKMSTYLIEQIRELRNVTVRTGTVLRALHGDEQLEAVTLQTGDGEPETVESAGVFTFIGARPDTGWLPEEVTRDEHGFVVTGDRCGARHRYMTSLAGVFAAGDVRSGSIKRVASGVGEGAAVVPDIHAFLSGAPRPA